MIFLFIWLLRVICSWNIILIRIADQNIAIKGTFSLIQVYSTYNKDGCIVPG